MRRFFIEAKQNAYDENKYVDRPPVASFRSKPSQHVERAKKKYGLESMNDLKTLSHRTGCSIDSLKKIVQKGQGAYYSSGSRPNQSAKAWGLARLASAVTGGKAKKYDINLLKQGGCDASVLSAGALYPKKPRNFYWRQRRKRSLSSLAARGGLWTSTKRPKPHKV